MRDYAVLWHLQPELPAHSGRLGRAILIFSRVADTFWVGLLFWEEPKKRQAQF
jgi:hypothetical protein